MSRSEIACPSCGASGPPDAEFCGVCGSRLPPKELERPSGSLLWLSMLLGSVMLGGAFVVYSLISPESDTAPSNTTGSSGVDPPATGESPPTTTIIDNGDEVNTTVVAVGNTGISSFDWTQVIGQTAFNGSLGVDNGQIHLFDVVNAGTELVAAGDQWFGEPMEGTDGSRGVVLVSGDGHDWERIFDSDLEDPDSTVLGIGGLGYIGNGILAVGSTLDPVVWLSPDARDWSVVYNEPEPIGFATMRDVTRAESGLIAVGNARHEAGVWTSVYVPEWTRVEGPVVATDGILDVMGVTATSFGVVAVGNERFQLPDGHSDWDAAVWFSEDGSSWTRIRDDDTFRGGQLTHMDAVVEGGLGFVAVGSDDSTGDPDAAVWVSENGRAWTQVASDGLRAPGDQSMHAIAAGPSGLVAVGVDNASGSEDAAIWVSSDGYEWSRVDEPDLAADGYQILRGVTAWRDGFVAVGHDDGDALVWVGSPRSDGGDS